jgi:uroporphyrin-3 C-methyltransferase
LQRADQTLQNVNDANMLDLRKSLAANIANLQALPAVDTTKLYLQIAGLQDVLNQLPLPAEPLSPNAKAAATTVSDPNMPWWQAGLNRSWQALRQLVVVRYNGSNTLPLVLPEEKAFLYQNLHAKLDNALWGVLHSNNDVYQISLAQAIAWVKQYFVQTAPATQSVLQGLQELQKVNIQPPTVNLTDSLQLFDRYFQQPESAATSS